MVWWKLTTRRYGTWRHCIAFIHSGYFYGASSSPLLLRGAPDTARILCRSFKPQATARIPTCRPGRDSNPRPFGWKVTNLPMIHHALHCIVFSFIIKRSWQNAAIYNMKIKTDIKLRINDVSLNSYLLLKLKHDCECKKYRCHFRCKSQFLHMFNSPGTITGSSRVKKWPYLRP